MAGVVKHVALGPCLYRVGDRVRSPVVGTVVNIEIDECGAGGVGMYTITILPDNLKTAADHEYAVVQITPYETRVELTVDYKKAIKMYLYSTARDIDLGYRTLMCKVSLDTKRECTHYPGGIYLEDVEDEQLDNPHWIDNNWAK